MENRYIQEHVGTSQFYMLRCLIVMAHADGVVCDEERAYIAALSNRLPLTEEQHNTLEEDFEKEQGLGELLSHINEPQYRSQVVYFARIMAYKDGVLHPSEDELLKKIHSYVVEGLDLETIREDVQKAVNAELLVHDISIDENRPMKNGHAIPWIQWLDELLLSLGIDLLG